MAATAVLNRDTTLYCPLEPEGRLFPAGSAWPGDAWSDKPGGEPEGKKTTAGALADLATANAKIEQLSATIANQARDLDTVSGERDQTNLKVAGLEQEALAAKAAQTTAEEAARGYMQERDQARENERTAKDATAKAQEALTAATASPEGVTAELEAANQTIADLNSRIQVLEAQAAPDKADATKPKG